MPSAHDSVLNSLKEDRKKLETHLNMASDEVPEFNRVVDLCDDE